MPKPTLFLSLCLGWCINTGQLEEWCSANSGEAMALCRAQNCLLQGSKLRLDCRPENSDLSAGPYLTSPVVFCFSIDWNKATSLCEYIFWENFLGKKKLLIPFNSLEYRHVSNFHLKKKRKRENRARKKGEKIIFQYFCTQKVKKKKRKIKTQKEEICWKEEVSHACGYQSRLHINMKQLRFLDLLLSACPTHFVFGLVKYSLV